MLNTLQHFFFFFCFSTCNFSFRICSHHCSSRSLKPEHRKFRGPKHSQVYVTFIDFSSHALVLYLAHKLNRNTNFKSRTLKISDFLLRKEKHSTFKSQLAAHFKKQQPQILELFFVLLSLQKPFAAFSAEGQY